METKKRRIYTHVSGDLDAYTSIWFASRFLKKDGKKICFLPFSKEKEEEIIFISASWNGYELRENDLALDIYAGGHGIKGDIDSQGRVHSCFFKLVSEYGDDEAKKILLSLAKAVDKHDMGFLSSSFASSDNENKLDSFIALKWMLNNLSEDDEWRKNVFFDFLDNFYQDGVNKLTSKQVILDNTIKVGEVAIFVKDKDQKKFSNRNELFNLLGFSAKVYVDGNHLGVVIKNDLVDSGLRADHPYVRSVVEKAGEIEQWFSHPSGFMYSWSCEKAPKDQSSKVDPYELAVAFEKARKEHIQEIQNKQASFNF